MRTSLLTLLITLSFSFQAQANERCSRLFKANAREKFICEYYAEQFHLTPENFNVSGAGPQASKYVGFLVVRMERAGFKINPDLNNYDALKQLAIEVDGLDKLTHVILRIAARTK